MEEVSFPAHGNIGVVNRIVPDSERESFIQKALKHKRYSINDADLSIFYRIADGTLSPLEGPMSEYEFYRVLDEEIIERNGKKYAWTIPLAFSIDEKEREIFERGETIAIQNKNGAIIGTLEISDIYYFDKQKYNKSVYGTERIDHPGPRIVNNDPREHLLGGKILALSQTLPPLYGKYMLKPSETRALFKKRDWERMVAFQTRNPLHRAHEYAMVYAMEKLTKEGLFTGVVLNPLIGETKDDDVPAEVRMKTYEVLIEKKLIGHGDKDEAFWKTKGYDLNDQLLLIALDMRMFYAGPKEAIMHAIYRQNLGFTDIIIGRRHADAPFDDGTQAWGDFDAQYKFDDLKGELLIKPFRVGRATYLKELGRVGLVEEFMKNGFTEISISGKELREKLEKGEPVDERIMRKAVADILYEAYRYNIGGLRTSIKSKNISWHYSAITKQDREKRNKHKGAVIWLTGLSSSGKSTIAGGLQTILFEKGCNIFILDGDNIRHGLNRDLGFSPEDREENIRRIGEVAKLFTEAGCLVITAFISPYRKDRDTIRSLFPRGDFIEVFVKASVSGCEQRDVKGLYKKARSGEIKEFTGISAPYEEPLNPELIVETEKQTEEESVQHILNYLIENGYVQREI
jgi:sulfate adenylyltransferase